MWAAATARVQWVPRWAVITCGASLQTLWLTSAQPTFGRLSQVAFRLDRAWAPRTDTRPTRLSDSGSFRLFPVDTFTAERDGYRRTVKLAKTADEW